jgi:hypothetical protein
MSRGAGNWHGTAEVAAKERLHACCGVGEGGRERERDCRARRIREEKWAPTDPSLWAGFQQKSRRRHCRTPRAALPPYPNSADLATDYVTLSISDMDTYPPYIITRNKQLLQTMVMLYRSSFIKHFGAL